MDERRDSPRRRTYLGAQVKRPGGLPLGECIVRDLSKSPSEKFGFLISDLARAA
jgi:hypothetical protein